jgi:hypothetical protein
MYNAVFTSLSESYHQHLTIIGHSAHGALVKYRYLLKFLTHLETEGIEKPEEVQPQHITAYHDKIKTNTSQKTYEAIAIKTLQHHMRSIELFFSCCRTQAS